MPVTQWVLGELQPWVRETLSPERLALHGLFDVARVEDWWMPRIARDALQRRQQGARARDLPGVVRDVSLVTPHDASRVVLLSDSVDERRGDTQSGCVVARVAKQLR